MSERRLFLLVEGNDDERFFSRIIVPLLAPRYRSVKLIKYACMKSNRVCRFIRSIHRSGDEVLVVADIDKAPVVAAKKQILMERFCVVKPAEILVIIQEIESWYLAGLETSDAHLLGVQPFSSTDQVTKEIFNETIPPHYLSRISYMLEILSRFSIPAACRKNRSFHYYMNRNYLGCDTQLPGEGRGEEEGVATENDEKKEEDTHSVREYPVVWQKGDTE